MSLKYCILLIGLTACGHKEPLELQSCSDSNSNKAPAGKSLEFIVLGDQGKGDDQAVYVAELIDAYAAKNPISAVIGTGDNFYPDGVTSLKDPKWSTHFEEIYDLPNIDFPFYMTMGNHDHRGSWQAQVNYSAHSVRWHMPGLYYRHTHCLPSGVCVDFFAIDTYIAFYTSVNARQFDWLEEQLSASKARWKVVYGHHPLMSNGIYGNDAFLMRKLLPLLSKYNVQLYLSGHEHHLEFMKPVANTWCMVSGAGSSLRTSWCGSNTLYNSTSLGFFALRFYDNVARVVAITSRKTPPFEYYIKP